MGGFGGEGENEYLKRVFTDLALNEKKKKHTREFLCSTIKRSKSDGLFGFDYSTRVFDACGVLLCRVGCHTRGDFPGVK